MMIDTDLVKNKKFISPIESSILKCSQEYRVLATLRYLYPSKYNTMIKGEAPDLQDREKSTGIEVTSAVIKGDMKVARAFSELKQGTPKDVENRKKIESSGYSFVHLPNGMIAISSTGTDDGEKRVFSESIRKKADKLQQYQNNFMRIGLAILLPEIPTSYTETHFSNWISEIIDESENMFDFIYVISHRFCLYYDTQGNSVEKRSISKDESCSLAKIARMTAEGELSMMDKEWH